MDYILKKICSMGEQMRNNEKRGGGVVCLNSDVFLRNSFLCSWEDKFDRLRKGHPSLLPAAYVFIWGVQTIGFFARHFTL